jgi:hypothetical protein
MNSVRRVTKIDVKDLFRRKAASMAQNLPDILKMKTKYSYNFLSSALRKYLFSAFHPN